MQRNHFDRLVHFAFGFLLARPLQDFLRHFKCSGGPAAIITPFLLLAGSSLYEIIESMAAQVVSPNLGELYLGSQGDIWDAQKDMSLGFLGAFLWIAAQWVLTRKKKPSARPAKS